MDWRVPSPAASAFAPPPAQPLFDVELGKIFLSMRTLLGISLWDMARRVGAEPTVIADLEAGALSALPPWPELTRLVDAYASATGIDQQPILVRLLCTQAPVANGSDQRPLLAPRTITVEPPASGWSPVSQPLTQTAWSAPGGQGGPIPESAFMPRAGTERTVVSTVPTAARRPMPGDRSPSRTPAIAPNIEVVTARPGLRNYGLQLRLARSARSTLRGTQRLLQRRVVGLTGLVLLPALIVMSARLFPAILYSVLAPLPAVVATPLHSGINQLVAAFAPEREGLTWIDIGDARLRKADRLPERTR
jgi:hypothetical protein